MSYSKNHNKRVINGYADFLKQNVYTRVASLPVELWKTKEPVPFKERESGEHAVINEGDKWGDLWDCAWMHITGRVPEQAKGKKVVVRLNLSGEGCVYDKSGYPIRGITTFFTDLERPLEMPVKRVIDITEKSEGNEEFDFWIDAGCNDLFGHLVNRGELVQAEISTCDDTLRELYYDYRFLALLSDTFDEDSTVKNQIEYTLFEVANHTDINNGESIAAAIGQLRYHLNMKNSDESLKLSAVGHAHIDLAWLWPIRETKRKAVRTFSTALRMMEKYPDYIFGASQPQLYEWVKAAEPGMYEEIKQRVKEGRWECQGAMWVEPDANLTGSEALVRQVVYGKKFFSEEFGRDMKILWLPDVFGYSAALPQILKKSDVPYFMTIKLSWNEHNTFPHNTFLWQGIDGSEILAHMPPENTYNSGAMPNSLRLAEKQFKDKDVSNEALFLFGIGDGGGSPSPKHLEYLDREKSIVGLPKTTQRPALDFFNSINEKRDKYAKWCGELYLEKHQGTYTSQADVKKYNRLMEFALRDCEFACSMAAVYAGFTYPQEEIEKIWKEVLLYQFHDILPGSSIKRVYDEAVARYKEIFGRTKEITDEANAALAAVLGAAGQSTVAFNTLGFERTESVKTPSGVKSVTIPAYGFSAADCAPDVKASGVRAKDGVLENELLRAVFDSSGSLVSLYDKQRGREVMNQSYKGADNLVIYEDKGDCWDIPFTYRDKLPQKLIPSEMKTENGSVSFTYSYGDSKITQQVTLPENSKKLVFRMTADWRETFKMLRAVYPVDINTDHANCNIQFGHIARPTHQNTNWDYAKIEICAHKWVDLSEKGFGVAMINDCKYGFNVWDNCLDIDLLRSQMHPGENADKGYHEFGYELFIHDGDLLKVTEESYKFNVSPMTAQKSAESGGEDASFSFMNVADRNVLIETVKLAEDRSGYILRLYECDGRRTKTRVNVKNIKSAELTTMTEKTVAPLKLEPDDGSFELEFRPFEIHTVKVKY